MLASLAPKLKGINEDGGVSVIDSGGGGGITGTAKKPVSFEGIKAGGDGEEEGEGGNTAIYAAVETLFVFSVKLSGYCNACAQYLRSLDARVCTLRAHNSRALCYSLVRVI